MKIAVLALLGCEGKKDCEGADASGDGGSRTDEVLAETLVELEELLFDMRRDAEYVSYGVFCGTDPRQFSPDEECSTEAEREAHRIDCERAERGEPRLTETACVITDKSIAMRPGYGLGTTAMQDEDLLDKCERLSRILEQLKNVAGLPPGEDG